MSIPKICSRRNHANGCMPPTGPRETCWFQRNGLKSLFRESELPLRHWDDRAKRASALHFSQQVFVLLDCKPGDARWPRRLNVHEFAPAPNRSSRRFRPSRHGPRAPFFMRRDTASSFSRSRASARRARFSSTMRPAFSARRLYSHRNRTDLEKPPCDSQPPAGSRNPI